MAINRQHRHGRQCLLTILLALTFERHNTPAEKSRAFIGSADKSGVNCLESQVKRKTCRTKNNHCHRSIKILPSGE